MSVLGQRFHPGTGNELGNRYLKMLKNGRRERHASGGADVFTAITILAPEQSSLQVLHSARPTGNALVSGNQADPHMPIFAQYLPSFFGYYPCISDEPKTCMSSRY